MEFTTRSPVSRSFLERRITSTGSYVSDGLLRLRSRLQRRVRVLGLASASATHGTRPRPGRRRRRGIQSGRVSPHTSSHGRKLAHDFVRGDPSSKTDPSGLCGCYAQYDDGSGYDGRCGCNAGSCGGTSGGGTSDGSSDPPQGTIHVRRQIDPPPSNNCAAGILICGYAYYNCVNNAINVLLWCINTECYGTNGPCTTGNTFWCDACISGCSYFEGTLLYGCAVSWRACIKSYCG